MPTVSIESILLDTNVLVYAVDPAQRGKSRRASHVVDAVAGVRAGVINSQVLTEFYAVTTRSRRGSTPILDGASAARWVARWLAMFEFRPITEMITREAVRGARDHQMNIYDAQIWAAAKLGAVELVVTEDTGSSRLLEGVRYVDPFSPGFTLAEIGL